MQTYDDYIEPSEYDMGTMTNNKYAVLMGRFQPLHEEHLGLFERIAEKYNNIIVLVGEQKGNDQLSYYERANLINQEIKVLFDKVAIMPMFDFVGDDEQWAKDVLVRLSHVTHISNVVLIKPRKNGDIDDEGNHYLDIFDDLIETKNIKIGNHDIHASDIRANPKENLDLVAYRFSPFVKYDIGKPFSKECTTREIYGDNGDWMSLRGITRHAEFVYGHRKNKDSVAFIFFNTQTQRYGILIEQKPPIGSMKTFSAFGGSFDRPTDNPYRVLNQEAYEEAGIKFFDPIYIGSYMATTQMDEIVHVYVLETTDTEFDPQTIEEGELGNQCLWVGRDTIESIPDWRIQLAIRRY